MSKTPDPNRSNDRDRPTDFQVVDKRHFVNIDSIPIDTAVEEKPRYPSMVEELMARLSETERRFEEKRKQVEAEIGRMKARLEADYERRISLEKQKLLLPFLEVLDNLERAVEAAEKSHRLDDLLQGVAMTASLFRSKLQESGIEAIPVLDQPFDPNLHQALGMIEVTDEGKDGVVVEEIVRGYRMGEQLLRPAQVRVGILKAANNTG